MNPNLNIFVKVPFELFEYLVECGEMLHSDLGGPVRFRHYNDDELETFLEQAASIRDNPDIYFYPER